MCNASKRDKKEVLWLISNMAANSEEDAISIVNSHLSFTLIMACGDNNYEIRREACWTLSNLCHSLK